MVLVKVVDYVGCVAYPIASRHILIDSTISVCSVVVTPVVATRRIAVIPSVGWGRDEKERECVDLDCVVNEVVMV